MDVTAEQSWTYEDKSTWGDGDWQNEPDKVQWVDEATGYDCLIVRGPSGALCGYVGLPPEHACHGTHYDRVRVPPTDPEDSYSSWPAVHGGLTFSDSCDESAEEGRGICHIPLEGRPDDVWWLGFDCAHSGDATPASDARLRESGFFDRYPQHAGMHAGDYYRDAAYVRSETARLAAQLVNATVAPEDTGDAFSQSSTEMLPTTDFTMIAAEGARIGLGTCGICGAVIMVDPRDIIDTRETHRIWHRDRGDFA